MRTMKKMYHKVNAKIKTNNNKTNSKIIKE